MNVVLVLLDSLRADHVGCYGYGPTAEGWACRTPAIDALSRESVRFTRAFPEALPTIPVRRAVHTGTRTFPFRGWLPQKGDTVRAYGWQRIPEEQVTLSETLQNNGYRTALITDAYHQFKPSMNFHSPESANRKHPVRTFICSYSICPCQAGIAAGMAVAVVDRLEVVEIDE